MTLEVYLATLSPAANKPRKLSERAKRAICQNHAAAHRLTRYLNYATDAVHCIICNTVLVLLGSECLTPTKGRVIGLSTEYVYVQSERGVIVHKISFFLRNISLIMEK